MEIVAYCKPFDRLVVRSSLSAVRAFEFRQASEVEKMREIVLRIHSFINTALSRAVSDNRIMDTDSSLILFMFQHIS